MATMSYGDPIFNEPSHTQAQKGAVKRVSSNPSTRPTPKATISVHVGLREGTHHAAKGSGPLGERPGSGDSVRSAGALIVDKTTSASVRKKSVGVGQRPNSSVASCANPVPQLPKQRANMSVTSRASPAPQVPADPFLVIDRKTEEIHRTSLVKAMAGVPNLDPSEDPRAFHGRAFILGEASAPQPSVVWKSNKKPRDNSPDWLTATEYADSPRVFKKKIVCLASLLRASHRTLAYTGAGLSVAAGIGMAALGSSGGAGTGMGVATAGEPTLAHCVMAELNRQNLLHGWVQQNHDGLPQKAGYKQEDINEIHGSWFDPSNPVVKYCGSLRGDLFADMGNQAQSADLVLVLGTSLTGLNADQCVENAAKRSERGKALGSVIISPQRTSQDGNAALRIFAKADDVMAALAKEFNFGPRAVGRSRNVKCSADLFTKEDKVLVPYDKNGKRSTTVQTYWNLSQGAKVCIGSNNNIKGAKQPNDKGISTDTVGVVRGRDKSTCSINVNVGGTMKKLGLWWLETAKRGGVEYLPLVNVNPEEIPTRN